MFVKICGVTIDRDIKVIIEAGADAVGFIAYPPSARHVTSERVKKLLKFIPDRHSIRKVAVFVNATVEEIETYIEAGCDTIQLHGDETADFADELRKRFRSTCPQVWRAIKLADKKTIEKHIGFPAEKILVDTFSKDAHGGTGVVGDWDLARYAVERFDCPVLLAGGLNLDNLEDAFRRVNPAGFDVSSGVESVPGIKNHDLVRGFIKRIRNSSG